MRKPFYIFFIFNLLVLFSCSPEKKSSGIIENPPNPQNKKAGRILKLQEKTRITDEGENFYFKSLRDLNTSSNGNIFMASHQQLLKFSPEGHFIKNLYKKGQGPGEISGYFHYAIYQKSIYVWDSNANKIIHMDREGNFIREFKLEDGPFTDFIGKTEKGFIFQDTIWPTQRKTSRLYDLKEKILLVSEGGKTLEEIHSFPKKIFLIALSKGGGFKRWADLHSVLSEDVNILYVSHTCEYLVKMLDLNKGKIIKRFRRNYPRVKYTIKNEREREFIKKHDVPEKKFRNDIQGFFRNKGDLWVETSTKDKEKGIMIDVFDEKGQYIDNFYLQLEGSLLHVHNDNLFALETDEKGNPEVVQYRILN